MNTYSSSLVKFIAPRANKVRKERLHAFNSGGAPAHAKCVCTRPHTRTRKTARTDVGRSPRAIDSRARVGVPRSHTRITLSGRSSSAERACVRLARTYLVVSLNAVRRLAAGRRSLRAPSPSLSLYLSLSLPPSLSLSLSPPPSLSPSLSLSQSRR